MKAVFLIISFVFCFFQCESKADSARNGLTNAETNVRQKLAKPLPGVSQNREIKMDKETLAKRVESLDPTVSEIIKAENSQIQEVAAAFLRDGKIYKVSKFAPTRPIIIFVGVVGEETTYLIGDVEKYFDFVKKAEVLLSSEELRKNYLLNFLEVTESQNERLQILESITEIKPRPNLKDAQKQKFEDFQDKYKLTVQPPKSYENGIFKIFAVKGQNLIRFDMAILQDGVIEKKETVLESDILIPYAL